MGEDTSLTPALPFMEFLNTGGLSGMCIFFFFFFGGRVVVGRPVHSPCQDIPPLWMESGARSGFHAPAASAGR